MLACVFMTFLAWAKIKAFWVIALILAHAKNVIG